jgi:hypothetical protein
MTSDFSGTLLVSCSGDNCDSIIREAKKTPHVISVYKPRDKNDVDIVINVSGSKLDIIKVKDDVFSKPDVRSVKYRITE